METKEQYDRWFTQQFDVDPLEEMYSLDWDYFQRLKKLLGNQERRKNGKI